MNQDHMIEKKLVYKILDLVNGYKYEQGLTALSNSIIHMLVENQDMKPGDVTKNQAGRLEKMAHDYISGIIDVLNDEEEQESPSPEEMKTVAECLEGLGQILKKLTDLKGN